MQLIDRYIYAVVRLLPSSRRKEVARLVKNEIEERSKQKAGNEISLDEEPRIREVLTEMGHPDEVAEKYYPRTFRILSLRMRSAFRTMVSIIGFVYILRLAGIVVDLINGSSDVVSKFTDGISDFAVNLLFLLLVFIIIDRVQKRTHRRRPFRVSKLPELPSEKSSVSEGRLLVDLLFTFLFLLLIVMRPEWLAYFRHSDQGWQAYPLLSEAFYLYQPFIGFYLILRILHQVYLAGKQKWDAFSRWAEVVLNILFLLLLFWIISGDSPVTLPENLYAHTEGDLRKTVVEIGIPALQGIVDLVLAVLVVIRAFRLVRNLRLATGFRITPDSYL